MANKPTPRIRKTIRIAGKRVSQYFRTQKAADAWYRKMADRKDALKAGIDLGTEEITVAGFAKLFIAKRVKEESHNIWTNDEQRMRQFVLPKMGELPLTQITSQEWASFFEQIVVLQGKSRATSNRVRALVSKMYSDAKRWTPRYADTNPIADTKPYEERKHRLSKIKNNFYESVDDLRKYLLAAYDEEPGYWVRTMIIFNTGMRQGESIPLQWRDMDFDVRVIRIERSYQQSDRTIQAGSKGYDEGEEYVVGMNDTLYDALKLWHAQTRFKKPTDFVCCLSDGRHMEIWHLRRAHERIIKRAGLKYITRHGLRHTYATHYLDQGGSIENLSKMLGHKDIKTTQIYTHVIPRSMREKANQFQISFNEVASGELSVPDLSPKGDSSGDT